jgi:hypothetical protein
LRLGSLVRGSRISRAEEGEFVMSEKDDGIYPSSPGKAQKAKLMPSKSFYQKDMDDVEVCHLYDLFVEIYGKYYSKMVQDSKLGKDVFEKIMVYTDLLLESESHTYKDIDAKTLQKKVKTGGLTMTDEMSVATINKIRADLLTKILKNLSEDNLVNLRNEENFKSFISKSLLYLYSGMEFDTKPKKYDFVNNEKEEKLKNVTEKMGGEKRQPEGQELEKVQEYGIEDKQNEGNITLERNDTVQDGLDRQQDERMTEWEDCSDRPGDSDDGFLRIAPRERVQLRRMDDGKWVDHELFATLVSLVLRTFQFTTMEEFLIQTTSETVRFSKDLLFTIPTSGENKPVMFLLLSDLFRVGVQFYKKYQNAAHGMLLLRSLESFYLNLLITNETLRKLLLWDKARLTDSVIVRILHDLWVEKVETEFDKAVVECRDNIFRTIFRAYLTKMEFKVSKSNSTEFVIGCGEPVTDSCIFSVVNDLFERKYRIANFGEKEQDEYKQELLQLISQSYLGKGLFQDQPLMTNDRIIQLLNSVQSLVSFKNNLQAFKHLRDKTNDAMVELSFKLEAEKKEVQHRIYHHENKYQNILRYLKKKIEISGISSESVMRSCRYHCNEMTKFQRDVNGLWKRTGMEEYLQNNRLFTLKEAGYEGHARNPFYDIEVDSFTTAQRTRPFLNFNLRRYWSDNYDAIYRVEESEVSKSVFFNLETKDKKRGRNKQEPAKPARKTGFSFFQMKRTRKREEQQKGSLLAADKDQCDKMFNENFDGTDVQFGRRCQLIDKFRIKKGNLYIIQDRLIFYINTFETQNYFSNKIKELRAYDKLKKVWSLKSIKDFRFRRLNQRKTAIELFFQDSTSVFLNFSSAKPAHKDLEEFAKLLKAILPSVNPSIDTRNLHLSLLKQFDSFKPYDRWLAGEISNFEYLMEVNFFAGRSYSELSQYPVFPWTIMINASLDPSLAQLFQQDFDQFLQKLETRDLTKPVGAIGDKDRLKNFIKRFNSAHLFDKNVPPYYYGSHYSTPAIVIYFLIRLYPYSEGAMDFQSGVFDIADRLFHSISKCFRNTMEEMSDIRELIPEFFYLPEMYLNVNKLDLGLLHTQERVNNVDLPVWADNNPYKMVYIMRRHLESKEVSLNLPNWIDLIFGFKQQGDEAIKNYNLFYHMTYDGAIDMDTLPERDRDAIETQVLHFGQSPTKLFTKPHPKLIIGPQSFWRSLNVTNDDMMAYTRKMKEGTSPIIDDLIAGIPTLGKTPIFCIRGKKIDQYTFDYKSIKEITEKNLLGFRLHPGPDISLSESKTTEALDFTDYNFIRQRMRPTVVLVDTKLAIFGGLLTGQVFVVSRSWRC